MKEEKNKTDKERLLANTDVQVCLPLSQKKGLPSYSHSICH